MNAFRSGLIAALIALAAGAPSAPSQSLGSFTQKQQVANRDAVTYLFPEQVTAPAGKPAQVELHFRVAQGLHINSHTPADDFLIPTVFSIPANAHVELKGVTYPPGVITTLPVDPNTKLSVYTGEFVIRARIVAAAGNHLVRGQLHYQACDNNECMPPKTIPVSIDVIGR